MSSRPREVLSLFDAVALTVGIVVGAGIFKTPSLIAAEASSGTLVLAAWLLGGLISLLGALCYAELASTYPDAGGEYHFLSRAYGRGVGFLFAWSRLLVVQTGSIALLGFVLGDYLNALAPLGRYGPAFYAGAAIVVFTAINMAGWYGTTRLQRLLTLITLGGLLLIVAAAPLLQPAAAPAAAPPPASSGSTFGLMMIFVLLTFGGWNEAAYLSAEVRDRQRNIVRALVMSIALITTLYLGVNVALLWGLGLGGTAASPTPFSALAERLFGSLGADLTALLIAIVVLASLNATILTGARSAYALARDHRLFSGLAHWNPAAGAPRAALLLQGAIALLLVVFGGWARRGFELMVEYVSPVFWLFFLLSALSLFVLRARAPQAPRGFRVPGYPWTPALFAAACAFLLYASVRHTGICAILGLVVIAAGLPALYFSHRLSTASPSYPPNTPSKE